MILKMLENIIKDYGGISEKESDKFLKKILRECFQS